MPCPGLLLPIPCADQSINPTCGSAVRKVPAWLCLLFRNLWSDAWVRPHVGAGYFCPVFHWVSVYYKEGPRSKFLLKLKRECEDACFWCSLLWRLWPAMKGRSVALGWVPSRHRWNRSNTKARILLAGFSQHCIRYTKKTSKRDHLFCDYLFIWRYCNVCIFQWSTESTCLCIDDNCLKIAADLVFR